MANKFFVAGAQRAKRVNDLFSVIALRYDLINDLQSFGLHRLWKRRIIQIAKIKADERALDLCCGTGDIALAMRRGGAKVVGLDFSGPMLAVAQKREAQSKLQKVEWIQADALQTPFPNSTFDVITIGYGLRNLISWEEGLIEVKRLAKPAGRVLVLDFGRPENICWRVLYLCYLRFFVPLFGKVFCGDWDTYSYILESLKHYPEQKAIADKMRALDFKEVKFVNLWGGIMSINYGKT
jgi:demethylmenaquinone methyltransferase/2-methoxy-6-polyprenyl-1,4-benzoquinol methylase